MNFLNLSDQFWFELVNLVFSSSLLVVFGVLIWAIFFLVMLWVFLCWKFSFRFVGTPGSLVKLVYFSRKGEFFIDDKEGESSKDSLLVSNDDENHGILEGTLHFAKFETSKINDCLEFIHSKQLHLAGKCIGNETRWILSSVSIVLELFAVWNFELYPFDLNCTRAF